MRTVLMVVAGTWERQRTVRERRAVLLGAVVLGIALSGVGPAMQVAPLAGELDVCGAVSLAPAPGGSVQMVPAPGLDGRYVEGTLITATAISAAGYHFLSWSGDAHGAENPISVTVDDDLSLTAHFAADTMSSDQRDCIRYLNRDLAYVTKKAERELSRCIRIAARGMLTGTIVGCVEDDQRGVLQMARIITNSDYVRFCTEDPPPFGTSDASSVNNAAIQTTMDLARDLFGPDLDAAIVKRVDDAGAYGCQRYIIGSVNRCQDMRLNTFYTCKGSGLLDGTITDPVTLADCLGTDPQGRISRACDPVTGRMGAAYIPKKCVDRGVDLSDAFPACSTGDGAELATCIDTGGRCRFCLAVQAADDLGDAIDCDLFDDGDTGNTSCTASVPG